MKPSEMPDRELDAAVAREVMGLKVTFGSQVGEPERWVLMSQERMWDDMPEYSTDPRAMMEAKLYCARNYGMAVTVITDQCGTICTVTHGAATYFSGVKNPQERECRAVCEGLLLAVRAEKGEGDGKESAK